MSQIDEILAGQQNLANTLEELQRVVGALQTKVFQPPPLEPVLDLEAVKARFGIVGGGSPGATAQGPNAIIAANSVDGAAIADGAIDAASKFAASIVPPQVVASLPALPNASFPNGCLVFLTSDQKLYRNASGTWSKAVDGADITANTITAGAIAAGAIGARALAVTSDRSNLLINGGFEDGYDGVPGTYDSSSKIAGWINATGVSSTIGPSASASGAYVALVKGDGSATNLGIYQRIPVVLGRRYRLSGRAWKGAAGGQPVQILAHARDKDLGIVAYNVLYSVSGTGTTPIFGESYYTVPSGVAFLDVYCRFAVTPAASEVFAFDDIALEMLPAGVENSPGEVLIDDSGITIKNGKLEFQDLNGSSVLTGAGFAGAWTKFLTNGVYNGDFVAGLSGAISASETGAGHGAANYAASLSPKLPYWVVKTVQGTLQRASDSTASGGITLQSTAASANKTNTIYQDVPIVPGHSYQLRGLLRYNGFDLSVTTEWMDSDHQSLGTAGTLPVLAGIATASPSTYAPFFAPLVDDSGVDVAPTKAAYVRVGLVFLHSTSSVVYDLSEISVREAPPSVNWNPGLSDITLSTTRQQLLALETDVAPGTYLFWGGVDFDVSASGVSACVGWLQVGTDLQSEQIVWAPTTTGRAVVSRVWVVTNYGPSAVVAQLLVSKVLSSGTALARSAHSYLYALRVG